MKKVMSPAEQLAGFLNFVDQCTTEYRLACDTVSEEDKRLQDLLHGIEFSENRSEADKELTKLRRSRNAAHLTGATQGHQRLHKNP